MTTNADIKKHIDWGMLSLAFVVLVQTGTLVWWASGIDRRVTALEQATAPLSAQAVTVGRLDERTVAMDKTLARIETRLSEERR